MNYPKPDEWLVLIDEFRKSGLQQKEFCAKKDVSLNTFRYWLYEKREEKRSERIANRVQRFLPVEVVASPAPKARVTPGGATIIEAAVQSGVVVRFVVGTDTRYLAELFAAIG
jgi:hypothetical protein